MPSPTDPCGALLLRITCGDETAFTQLYSEYSRTLLLVLLRRHQERAEAERALYRLFTEIWTRCHSFDPHQESGVSWLLRLDRESLAPEEPRARVIGEALRQGPLLMGKTPPPPRRPVGRGRSPERAR